MHAPVINVVHRGSGEAGTSAHEQSVWGGSAQCFSIEDEGSTSERPVRRHPEASWRLSGLRVYISGTKIMGVEGGRIEKYDADGWYEREGCVTCRPRTPKCP